MTGYVVFAHGSSVESANEAVRVVTAQLRERSGFEAVETAFLEGGRPDLRGAVEALSARGVGVGGGDSVFPDARAASATRFAAAGKRDRERASGTEHRRHAAARRASGNDRRVAGSGQGMQAKLIESSEIAPEVRHFVFEVPEVENFTFVPGQFVSMNQVVERQENHAGLFDRVRAGGVESF